jgi:hypothetical protein
MIKAFVTCVEVATVFHDPQARIPILRSNVRIETPQIKD